MAGGVIMQYATITEHIIKEPLWMKRGPMAIAHGDGIRQQNSDATFS
jgi:hypothetical protein